LSQSRREELAWAAGFMDGDGNFTVSWRKNGKTKIAAQADQIDRRVLDRLQSVLGGAVYGPYNRGEGRSPVYKWTTQTFEHVQAMVAMLWIFLSPYRQDQAKRCLSAWRDR
jgi:hypothetical protein